MLIQNSIHTLINIAQAYEAAAFRGNEAERLDQLRSDLGRFQRDLMIDLSAVSNLNPIYGANPYHLMLNLKFSDGEEHVLRFGLGATGLYQAVLGIEEFREVDEGLRADITIRFDNFPYAVPTKTVESLLSRASVKGQLKAECETYMRARVAELRKLPV